MDKEKCKDCINCTVNGCALDKEPDSCDIEMPLSLMMEVGLI